MKTFLLFCAFLSINFAIGQIGPFPFIPFNQSSGNVATSITNPIGAQSGEIFRFRPGNVRQLDSGTTFNFTNSRWFSLGRVNTGSQNVYGLRFQLPNKSLTFGYQDITSANPRIQWIGSGADLGNLEFRVATSFTSTNSTLVARMTNEGNTFFGEPLVSSFNTPKVGVQNTGRTGILISSSGAGISPSVTSSTGLSISQSSGTSSNTGAAISTSASNTANGISVRAGANRATAVSASASGSSTATDVIGVRGSAFTSSNTSVFEAGIYGQVSPFSSSTNQFAGFFDGDVVTTAGSVLPSDRKLKNNIEDEESVLDRLALLRPVTYTYKEMNEINLAEGLQHGFISQELEEVFPELTKDITKPVFDKEDNIVSKFSFKAINYNGLIPVLTAAVNELNEEVQYLREELAQLREKENSLDNDNLLEENAKAILEQNVPNPFTDRTSIRYELQEGITNASLMVFDMNGKIVREFKLVKTSGEITIDASQVGKGMFIYSLVQNGQELISKKMIIK